MKYNYMLYKGKQEPAYFIPRKLSNECNAIASYIKVYKISSTKYISKLDYDEPYMFSFISSRVCVGFNQTKWYEN